MSTIFATAFSPDGRHLVCGTSSGELHVWAVTSGTMETMPAPDQHHIVQLHRCAVYSLIFVSTKSGTLLVSGSDEDIRGWRWDDLLDASSAPVPAMELQNPRKSLRRRGLGPLSETSALVHDPLTNVLYSAAGDGNAYAWDLSTHQCVSTFSGHSDQLHCIAARTQRRQIVTGSEDGTVRLWDVRTAGCTGTLLADGTSGAKSESAAAPSAYGWCGCLAVDASENWLVAGWGAGFLCTFELNTLACVACLPTAAAPQAACFLPGSTSELVTAGAEPNLCASPSRPGPNLSPRVCVIAA